MVSLVCGVAAYIVTFALATFCVRYLQGRRNAERGLSQTPRPKEKTRFNSYNFWLLLFSAALACGMAAARSYKP